MRRHLQAKHKAELIEKAVRLKKHGYNYESISKMIGEDEVLVERWVDEYLDYQIYKDPSKLICIKRCVPHFTEIKPKENKRKKITILWGLITIS